MLCLQNRWVPAGLDTRGRSPPDIIFFLFLLLCSLIGLTFLSLVRTFSWHTMVGFCATGSVFVSGGLWADNALWKEHGMRLRWGSLHALYRLQPLLSKGLSVHSQRYSTHAVASQQKKPTCCLSAPAYVGGLFWRVNASLGVVKNSFLRDRIK